MPRDAIASYLWSLAYKLMSGRGLQPKFHYIYLSVTRSPTSFDGKICQRHVFNKSATCFIFTGTVYSRDVFLKAVALAPGTSRQKIASLGLGFASISSCLGLPWSCTIRLRLAKMSWLHLMCNVPRMVVGWSPSHIHCGHAASVSSPRCRGTG